MRSKGTIIILLLGLLFIKVSAFHVYAHDNAADQIENCGHCELAIENQQLDLSTPDPVPDIVTPPSIVWPTKFALLQAEVAELHHSSKLFTRPPPQSA